MEAFTYQSEFSKVTGLLQNSSKDIVNTKYTDLLSDESVRIFESVNILAICCVVSLFGMTANSINIIIFYKQGFSNTVNIAFFALAISDLFCLTALLWVSLSTNPLFAIICQQLWIQEEVMYITAAWPHICFCRITSFITVYVTAERFLCISLPLKVKQIITPSKTIIIIFIIYFINLATLIPEYATSYLHWKFIPEQNRTLYGLMFTNSRKNVEGMCYVMHSILGMTSFVAVIFFTSLLVFKLSQATKWRKSTTSTNNQREHFSARDKNTVKMVVMIASILILCYTPGAVIALTTYALGPDFDIMGKYVNIRKATWSISFSVQGINSSINIFLYYSMSSKYRETVQELFCRRVRDVGKVTVKSK